MSERDEILAGYREMLDFLDAHPEVPIGRVELNVFAVLADNDTAAVLGYDPADPYTIRLDFPEPDHNGAATGWILARDLLADGMDGPQGVGDVEVWPEADYVCVRLTGDDPDGFLHADGHRPTSSSVLRFPQPTVHYFLRLTYGHVPRGRESERVDVDGWIGRILAGAS